MIEIITDFLHNEKRENDFLNRLTEKYTISDFVMVDKDIKEAIPGRNMDAFGSVYGCMYYCRDKHLRLNTDIVEQRLTNMYMDFLLDVLSKEDEKEKVRNILALHYLGVLEQLAFQLTVSSGAPFKFLGQELSPHGEQEYASYQKIWGSNLHVMIPFISENDIRKYHRIFYQYRYSALNAKHFSLMEYMLNHERTMGSEWEAEDTFVDMMDLFVFRYKAVFVTERLSAFMQASVCDKVIESLVEI